MIVETNKQGYILGNVGGERHTVTVEAELYINCDLPSYSPLKLAINISVSPLRTHLTSAVTKSYSDLNTGVSPALGT